MSPDRTRALNCVSCGIRRCADLDATSRAVVNASTSPCAVEIPFAKVLAFALSLAAPGTAFVVVSCVKTGAASGTKSSESDSESSPNKEISLPSIKPIGNG